MAVLFKANKEKFPHMIHGCEEKTEELVLLVTEYFSLRFKMNRWTTFYDRPIFCSADSQQKKIKVDTGRFMKSFE